MEADIILEGFWMSEGIHGLIRYLRFIGDGDSSVHNSLITGVPTYVYDVTKVDCTNHVVKCYRNRLEWCGGGVDGGKSLNKEERRHK